MRTSTRSAVAGTALTAFVSLGATATASASVGPDLTPLIDTTCTYSQVIAGINDLDPGLGDEIANFPPTANKLQQFLAAPVGQRQAIANQELDDHPHLQEIIDAVEGDPGGQMDIGILTQVSQSCNSYPTNPAPAGPPAPPAPPGG